MRLVLSLVAVALGLFGIWLYGGGSSSAGDAARAQAPSASAQGALAAPTPVEAREVAALTGPIESRSAPPEIDPAERRSTEAAVGDGGRRLSVRFVDRDGRPLSDVRATLVVAGGGQDAPERALVEDRVLGAETELTIEEGDRLVRAVAAREGFAAISHTVAFMADPEPVATFVLERGGLVRLRAVDGTGAPVDDVRPRIEGDPDQDPALELRWVPSEAPGEVLLSTATGGRFRVELWSESTGSAALDVDLDLGELRDLGDVLLVGGPTIEGRVVLADGTPVAGVGVVAARPGDARDGGSSLGATTTDERGEFALETLADGPLEVFVGLDVDLSGTTWTTLEPGQEHVELVSPAVLAIVSAPGDDGPLPMGTLTVLAGDSDVPFEQWSGRFATGGVRRNLRGARELRLLLAPEFPWRFTARTLDGAGAEEELDRVAELPFDRRARLETVELSPSAEPADASIVVEVTFDEDATHGEVDLNLTCSDLGVFQSRRTKVGGPVEFDRLRSGTYRFQAHVWAPRAGELPGSGVQDLVVAPREVEIELDGGGRAQITVRVERGAVLELDLSALSASAEAAPEDFFSHNVEANLEGLERQLSDREARPWFNPVKSDGTVDNTVGSDFPALGQHWRSSQLLAPGRYRARVELDGYRTWTTEFVAEPGEAVVLAPILAPGEGD